MVGTVIGDGLVADIVYRTAHKVEIVKEERSGE